VRKKKINGSDNTRRRASMRTFCCARAVCVCVKCVCVCLRDERVRLQINNMCVISAKRLSRSEPYETIICSYVEDVRPFARFDVFIERERRYFCWSSKILRSGRRLVDNNEILHVRLFRIKRPTE